MLKPTYSVRQATIDQSSSIASLITVAMTDECCKYFCGPNHTIEEFHKIIIELSKMENSQYSYKNTLVAVEDSNVIGISVSYDGSQLNFLRKAFLQKIKEEFKIDFSNMDDETSPGELYIDSLAVAKEYRRRGVATKLIDETIVKARKMGIRKVGLLVDKDNPKAEKFYLNMGFENVGENKWGGHEMKHLQIPIDNI